MMRRSTGAKAQNSTEKMAVSTTTRRIWTCLSPRGTSILRGTRIDWASTRATLTLKPTKEEIAAKFTRAVRTVEDTDEEVY